MTVPNQLGGMAVHRLFHALDWIARLHGRDLLSGVSTRQENNRKQVSDKKNHHNL